MKKGWIKLFREMLDWEWYHDTAMVRLFIHLLLKANHKDGMWQGIPIKRGQLVTGLKSLSEETGLSTQVLRRCIATGKSTAEWTIQSTNRFSIITICKYDDYQGQDDEDNKQTNSPINSPINNKQEEKKKRTIPPISPKGENFRAYTFWEEPEFQVVFKSFKEMRNKMRKPLTDLAIIRLLAKIQEISKKTKVSPSELLATSVDKGWQTVYEPKTDFKFDNHYQKQTPKSAV